jgi:small subunit ribosomal protein S4
MTEKCAVERRTFPPGQHGQARPRASEYSTQLREKQKLKRTYGVLERQFRGVFSKAERQEGITGENLLRMLERRLDNVVYRLGFAASRSQARQLINHGHFRVNDRKVNKPSFLVREGDVIAVKERSRSIVPIMSALEGVDGRGVPGWLDLDKANYAGSVRGLPAKDEIQIPVNEQLVVDLYSR